MCVQATEVSELQTSINALRRQNWSQLPDRAPLELVDVVAIPAVATSASAATSGGVSCGVSGSGSSTSTNITAASAAVSPAHRTSGKPYIQRRFDFDSTAVRLLVKGH